MFPGFFYVIRFRPLDRDTIGDEISAVVLKFQMRLEALSRLSINRQQLGVAIGPVSDLLALF